MKKENKRRNRKLWIGAVALMLVTSIFTTFVLSTIGVIGILPYKEYRQYKKLVSLSEKINEDFYKKPDKDMLETGIYKGLFAGLGDVYSAYYTKDEMKQLLEASSGKYVGVGMTVGADKETGRIRVESTFDKSPAKEAGIQKGDFIVRVDGKSYTYQEMDIAVKNMRGKAGTSVKISLIRGNRQIEKIVVRRQITIQTIESRVLENNLGYISIKSFDEDTADDFRSALKNLEAKNIKGLIVDVRDDGGGLLDVVENIADRLLGKAVIVYTQDNKGNKEYLRSSDKEKISIPVVVLTNGNSASASEILTGAILDNKAGISVGTTTYGKGLVQQVVPLRDGTGYKLTTAQYFTPNGSYINEKGIKPTIEVKEEKDQLPRAISYLKEKIK
ncbi:S41 family peptidase [Peptostreptococcus anaerobius]|uniref:S41 family peptidase n=1 Tax=Peptostreptococcus TaxID=1257 RepID=UPI001DC25028|nr:MULTISPECIES: S41 family peptidase [Peptostreptococcus]MBS5596412.1 S41 family peptidase [Peptostreptococcus sp.]MDB8821915.1 S41 family peptidase [Peptostreptococcus anaerobius]MDB8826586.1 S41 family peptidase [Peptostreptococcus anaerobius]MDB8828451.1 S41 family peptidase [Peptostreptococcus anaerobius]MDB8830211.1 S41 family peptidase [Peptostreptococcus anaerobius]